MTGRYKLDAANNPVFSHEGLVRHVIDFCPGITEGLVRWGYVSRVFGLGSTYSIALCRELGFDPNEIKRPFRPVCDGCDQEIDPDTCGCGSAKDGHQYDGHPFIPMGCDCHRVQS
jgi:hypothetical protein